MTTKPLSSLEMELIKNGFSLSFEFNGYYIYKKGERMILYDQEKRDIIPFKEGDDLCECVNSWAKIKRGKLG